MTEKERERCMNFIRAKAKAKADAIKAEIGMVESSALLAKRIADMTETHLNDPLQK